MSDPNLSSPTSTSSSELVELRELCADLRWQTHTLRAAILIVATILSGFFWLDVRRNGQALEFARPQAAKVIEANKTQDPIANKFVSQLVEFGKTHPDFAAILNKYGIRETPVSAPTTAAPAAAVPAAPKK